MSRKHTNPAPRNPIEPAAAASPAPRRRMRENGARRVVVWDELPGRPRATLRELVGERVPLESSSRRRAEFPRRRGADPDAPELVVAVDFSACSRAAARHADRLARQNGARLHLLHVHDVPPAATRQGSASILAFHRIEEDAKTRLDALARSVDADATIEFRVGDPARVILQRAEEREAAGIVLGADERGGAGTVGSVAREVRSHAPCNVVLVREPAPPETM